MNIINLSYIITTKNKLPYLKLVLSDLLENVEEDEEIVVVDGNSTDGTKEYLATLYQQGKIHQYISEPDKGEAHGWNKALLLAKGELIKLISDDDVYYYPVIKKNKQYMANNAYIDIMMGNTAVITPNNELVIVKNYEEWFKQWSDRKITNFSFCGLPIMIRKASIPMLGLFDTSFKHVDFEYSVRVTTLKARIAWNTALIVLALRNPESNSVLFGDRLKIERYRIRKYYNHVSLRGSKTKVIEADGMPLHKYVLKRVINKIKEIVWSNNYPECNIYIDKNNILDDNASLVDIFANGKKFLKEHNAATRTTIVDSNQLNK